MKIKNEIGVKVKQPKQLRAPISKDTLIIGIIVGIVLLLTIGIIVYYFVFANKETVATYDGGKVTREEYEMYYKLFAPWLSYYHYTTDKMATYIAEKIILDKLVLEKAAKENFKLSEADKEEVDKLFTSSDEIKSLTKKGINPENLKNMYYNDAIISDYMENLKTKATTEEVKAYILQTEGTTADLTLYNTSHILFQFTEDMTDTEKAGLYNKAATVLKEAIAGKDFAKLAEDNSQDTSSKDDGGAVKVTNNNSVYPEYMETVLKLKESETYPKIVETEAGYHIIKLNSKENNGRLTYTEDISNYIYTKLTEMQTASNYKLDTERITALAEQMNMELGISDSTSTSSTTAQ